MYIKDSIEHAINNCANKCEDIDVPSGYHLLSRTEITFLYGLYHQALTIRDICANANPEYSDLETRAIKLADMIDERIYNCK